MIENVKRGDFVWKFNRDTLKPESYLVTAIEEKIEEDKIFRKTKETYVKASSESFLSNYEYRLSVFSKTEQECFADFLKKLSEANNLKIGVIK